jgi:hypothetical protein
MTAPRDPPWPALPLDIGGLLTRPLPGSFKTGTKSRSRHAVVQVVL